MAVTREEKMWEAMLNDAPEKIPTAVTRKERMLQKLAKQACDNDTFSGGGTGGVSSWNDLTDKPFGEVETLKTLISEEVTVSSDGEGGFTDKDSILVNYPFEDGQECIVDFNGVRHDAKVQFTYDTWSMGDEMFESAPFYIALVQAAGFYTVVFRTKTAGTYFVEVIVKENSIQTIPQEYMPAGLVPIKQLEEVGGTLYTGPYDAATGSRPKIDPQFAKKAYDGEYLLNVKNNSEKAREFADVEYDVASGDYIIKTASSSWTVSYE